MEGCLVLAVLSLLAVAGAAGAATLTVDSTADDFDLGPNGNCTLREAVLAAEGDAAVDGCPAGDPAPLGDLIVLPEGVYVLAIPGMHEDAGATGDLDVASGALEIAGAGAPSTVVDGAGLDRVFHLLAPAAPVTISGLTLRGAFAGAPGGAVRNEGGDLELVEVWLTGNAGDRGGGLMAEAGAVTVLDRSAVSGNFAPQGGAVYNSGGTFVCLDSTLSGNTSVGGGGALYTTDGGSSTLTDCTLSGNLSDPDQGIFNEPGADTTLVNTLVDGDCAGGGTTSSGGGNLESPGDTCGLDQPDDQSAVSAAALALGPLGDHGGPTPTHLPGPASAALDAARDASCSPADQRGVFRPLDGDGDLLAQCDVGAVEVAEIFSDGFESGDSSAWD